MFDDEDEMASSEKILPSHPISATAAALTIEFPLVGLQQQKESSCFKQRPEEALLRQGDAEEELAVPVVELGLVEVV